MQKNSDMKNSRKNFMAGQLIMEILIVLFVVSFIVTVGAQLIVASLQGSKVAQERDVALGIAGETLDIARAVASEQWLYFYKPPDGAGNAVSSKGAANHYHFEQSGGTWVLAAGDDAVVMNGITYARYITIDNTSRDTNKDIESVYTEADDDPSTQKITATVSWVGADPVVIAEYMTRWMNKACAQSDWGGTQSAAAEACTSTNYSDKPAEINTDTGSLKLNPQ
jgi:type II secretory pathway pseudopilin PulG